MMSSRPRYHFTPPKNFMNDPNGLVFYDGEYHLFYQHNPLGDVWGHMSWGHAISRDLVRWEHLPVALYEEESAMIFSGSALVDWQNTSGFGTQGKPPLVAVYTAHSEIEQTQNIAYSIDRGRTWTKYSGNPVIAIGLREFRDPKVFWHEPTQRWIMVTVLSEDHKVRFDGSTDLKHWTYLSDFGPAGATDGLWECPDLFPLQGEDEPEIEKWVLKLDVLKGAGAQYFLGDFDGMRFTIDSRDNEIRRVDFGDDFYAAQSWSDEPTGRRIWIGWLNNWHYANVIPTSPWRGLFSIPRELRLRKFAEGLHLIQKPIEEVGRLRQPLYHVTDIDIATANAQLATLKIEIAQEIRVEFVVNTAFEFGLKLCTSDSEETIVAYDARAKELFLDRQKSGDNTFSDRFAGLHRAHLRAEEGKISMHIFVDSCSLEVFANGGITVMSDLFFPHSANARLEFYAVGGAVHLRALDVWSLADKT